MIRLVALKQIRDGIGTIDPGQEFITEDPTAEAMIADGIARLPGWIKHAEGKWLNAEAVIMASGPSLTKEDVETVRIWRSADPGMRKVIVVNTTYQIAPWADVLYSADNTWWAYHYENVLRDFQGERWSVKSDKNNPDHDVQRFEPDFKGGLSQKRGTINSGFNSGFQAIGAAYDFGVRRMVLLGFDMQPTGGKTHWHGDHPKPLHQPRIFNKWISAMNHMAHDLRVLDIEVINASRATALTCFPRATIEEALGVRANGHRKDQQ